MLSEPTSPAFSRRSLDKGTWEGPLSWLVWRCPRRHWSHPLDRPTLGPCLMLVHGSQGGDCREAGVSAGPVPKSGTKPESPVSLASTGTLDGVGPLVREGSRLGTVRLIQTRAGKQVRGDGDSSRCAEAPQAGTAPSTRSDLQEAALRTEDGAWAALRRPCHVKVGSSATTSQLSTQGFRSRATRKERTLRRSSAGHCPPPLPRASPVTASGSRGF